MSFTTPHMQWALDQILYDTRVSAAACRLAGILAVKFYDEEKGYAWPGHKALAKLLGVSDRTVRTLINELVALGYLKVVSVHGANHETNRYQILFPNRKHASTSELPTGNSASSNRKFGVIRSGRNLPTSQTYESDIVVRHSRQAGKADEEGSREELTPSKGAPPLPVDRTVERKSPDRRKQLPSEPWPYGFALDAEMRQLATEHGFQNADPIFEKFKAHAQKHDRRCVSWKAAWKKWLSNERKPAQSVQPELPSAIVVEAAIKIRRGEDVSEYSPGTIEEAKRWNSTKSDRPDYSLFEQRKSSNEWNGY